MSEHGQVFDQLALQLTLQGGGGVGSTAAGAAMAAELFRSQSYEIKT